MSLMSVRGRLAVLPLGVVPLIALAQTPPPTTTPTPPPTGVASQQVEIIGTSPLPGQGVERDKLPYGTQVLRRDAIEQAQADNATDLLARRLPGMQVNDVQGSPFQADLTFRGFRASGILGASQGLSVYLDGVRVNEPFGDVVNWDMVPEFALRSVSIVPGANPAFGLNTLGGAISMTTASGRTAPGLRGEASFGSFGRKRFEASHGGVQANGLHHFVGVGLFDERGWRDFSAGRLGTAFGKVGYTSDEVGEVSLSALVGRSRLVGNNPIPWYAIEDDGSLTPDLGLAHYRAVYNHPDVTRNRLEQVHVNWRRDVPARGLEYEALVYARKATRSTLNGDEADGDPVDGVTASFNRTATTQRAQGASFAVSGRHGPHQWQAGVAVDQARVSYEQTEQEAAFDATRGVRALDEAPELSVSVQGRSRAFGLYATDTWALTPSTHLTATVRFNRARVSNALTSVDDDTDLLTVRGEEGFTYRSANPALGLTHKLGPALTVFANIARNNRVPTVIELGCADPDEPCRLPAGLQSDPYLDQVIATSIELGARFRPAPGWQGSLIAFHTDNRNDILFRSVSVTGQQGYFQNFPRTRYRGVDAELEGKLGQVDLHVAYSHLRATYEAVGTLRMGERNVAIVPGTRIASLPRHMLKLGADASLAGGVTVGADVQALSRRGTSGNEDGRLEDGSVASRRLDLPGYALLNLRASWKPPALENVELFARVTNVTDRRFGTFGAIAQSRFDARGAYAGDEHDAWFVAPGAPRAFNVGLRWKF